MYNVKIIITNQNSVKKTTAEMFFPLRKILQYFGILQYFLQYLNFFAILFTILEFFCNTFCNTWKILQYFLQYLKNFAILFAILENFCNTFYNTWKFCNKYCNTLRFCNTYWIILWCCNTKVLQYFAIVLQYNTIGTTPVQHTWKISRSYENGLNSMNPHSSCST